MKHFSITVAFIVILALAASQPVIAQTNNLPSAGTTPGSPLYFVERLFEGVGTLFTFGNDAKAERHLTLAEERLAEAMVLVESNDFDPIFETALSRYEEQYVKAKERAERTAQGAGGDASLDLLVRITDAATKHISVLDELIGHVSEQAKTPIQTTKEHSITGQIETLRGIAERDPGKTVDIFSRAAEARLRSGFIHTTAQQGRGANDDNGDEIKRIEAALDEYEQYAEFGEEIATLAGGIRAGEITVDELIEKATSHHLDVLRDLQSGAPARAQEIIEQTILNAERMRILHPAAPTRPQSQEQLRAAQEDEAEEDRAEEKAEPNIDLEEHKLGPVPKPINRTGEELADEVIAELEKLAYLDELDKDIDDFNLILKTIADTKKQYITVAKDVANERANALNDFSSVVSDAGIRDFVQSLISDYRRHEKEANSIYGELFSILEEEVVSRLNNVRNAREDFVNNQFSGDVGELLSKNNREKERFINLIPRFTESAQGLEKQKSDNFTEQLVYIRNLIAVRETAADVSQQLAQIEQEAYEYQLPSKEFRCWATTDYEGGINGIFRTSVRCE